jgi:hypothetical protein
LALIYPVAQAMASASMPAGLPVVKDRYHHPAMQGSCSIKKVLPARLR